MSRRRKVPVWWTAWSAVVVAVLLLPDHARAALYGLIDNGQIVVSDDGGASWETRGALAVSDAIGLVAVTSNAVLYLLTRSGTVYTSSNSGADWDAAGGVTAPDVVAVGARDDLALRCDTAMVVLALLSEPDVVRKILLHLDLPADVHPLAPAVLVDDPLFDHPDDGDHTARPPP